MPKSASGVESPVPGRRRKRIDHSKSSTKLHTIVTTTTLIPHHLQPSPVSKGPRATVRANPYGRVFWLVYLANFLLVTANALTFRFADFVVLLGGTVATAGLIVGVGTAGSIVLRLLMGRSIDRYGPRPVWLASAGLFVVANLAFVPLGSLGPAIYGARLLFTLGLSGMFTCAFVCVCADVPATRRAEVIGILGTSGFLGMLLGPALGDLLFNTLRAGPTQFAALFGITAALGVAHFGIVWRVVRPLQPQTQSSRESMIGLFVRYWPGPLVVVALMMGVMATVPSTFLTRFAVERSLSGIGFYFAAFAVTAALVRVVGRNLPERVGRPKALVAGMAGMALSMTCYGWVGHDWHLILPGLLAGVGHGLLFPCAVSLGADAFPDEHRGTAMNLIMGCSDLGMLLGAPALGWVAHTWGFGAMFLTTASLQGVCAVYYTVDRLLRRRDRRTVSARNVSQPVLARSA